MQVAQASKPHSTPLTLKWLEENYEMAEGVCIPRSTLYMHYLDYCGMNDSQPVNAASFGKIIRQQFPQITTRRLGTRGQSKYHYYGVGIKESSIYFDLAYSRKGFFSNADGKKESLKQVYSYSPRSKLGTMLPNFPDLQDIYLPPSIPTDRISTFLVMYRTHCQRVLDNVIRANFEEIQSFLLHFWRGMPQHIVPLMNSRTVVDLVGVCDSILYRSLANVLVPSVLQPVSESLIQMIRKFARHIEDWIVLSIQDFPKILQQMKIDMTRKFSQMLRRQASLNHLCQAVKSVISSQLLLRQMAHDWSCVDLTSVLKQTLFSMEKYSQRDYELITTLQREFEELLNEQVCIETYCQWLFSIVERCVKIPSSKTPTNTWEICRQFLLTWSCYGSRVIRDMTLQSSFHLLHLMFDEYVMYLVETFQFDAWSNQLLTSITKHPNTVPNIPERQSVITDGRDFLNANC
ncbi:hypothetical protein HELRODRAFT_184328 [Helobdella robusta]|uniref:RFX-type winged-helix domain-containing protein n=1 Tax=Helobdella robusta TaxID=6412 RepID=T1FL04_HELRO|nr:hypothetical protein HELRODRAFT_184328 [Helobdella robusta]ESO01201.1 hypothetical protein HELRODRAFT_184328 [Helobdella robusta]